MIKDPDTTETVSTPPAPRWSLRLRLALTLAALALLPSALKAQVAPRGMAKPEAPPQAGLVLSPYSQGARVVVQRILAQSALLDGSSYLGWGDEAKATVDSGALFLRSGPLIDGAGVEVAGGTLGEGVATVAASPEVIFEALSHPEAYPSLFEYVLEATVHGRSQGGGAEHLFVYQVLDILGPVDAKAYLKMGARSLGDGSYFLWWDAISPGMVSNSEGQAVSPNMLIFSGSWRIIPQAEGSGSLVYYTGISLPAYYLPGWLGRWTFVGMEVPGLFEALEELGGAGG